MSIPLSLCRNSLGEKALWLQHRSDTGGLQYQIQYDFCRQHVTEHMHYGNAALSSQLLDETLTYKCVIEGSVHTLA